MTALGALPFLAVAVFTDLKERKIRNWLTVPMFLLGLVAAHLAGGAPGLVSSIKGAGVCLLGFMVLPYQNMGGGDLKLAAGCGAWLGLSGAVSLLWFTVLFTSVWAVVFALWKLGIRGCWQRLKQEMSHLLFKVPVEPLGNLPGAVFLGAGYLAVLLSAVA